MKRPSKDENFMELAEVIAKRANCLRRSVGCVIVDRFGYILSTGYNGTPKGFPHCDELNCSNNATTGSDLDSCNALHAEQNAIARLEAPLRAHTMYCTTEPCVSCLKLILATSIQRVVFKHPYPGKRTILITNLNWEQL